jgi:hypothetical protein
MGAEAESSTVRGDDADPVPTRGKAVDPASSTSFAWHGLLRCDGQSTYRLPVERPVISESGDASSG